MNTVKDIRKLTIDQIQSWITERMPKDDNKQAKRLVDYYFRQTQSRDLLNISIDDYYGSILSLWQFVQQRTSNEYKVRAYNPNTEEHYWNSTHSIIEIIVDDMPFLVASILMVLDRLDITVHNLNHPVIMSQRNNQGQLIALKTPENTLDLIKPEALMRIEIDRQTDIQELKRITAEIRISIRDVQQVIKDQPAMEEQLDAAIDWCKTKQQPVSKEEQEEILKYLKWLKLDTFLFIGYRYYEFSETDQGASFKIKNGSGLGAFRDEFRVSSSDKSLSPSLAEPLQEPELLVITKSSRRSSIQRPSHLDYLGIKQFDENKSVIGEWCFFGLFSSYAYSTPHEQVPLVRAKVAALLESANTPKKSYHGKALRHIINTFPRDEILQSSHAQLHNTIMGILDCHERRILKAFLRPDGYGRFVSVMVYVPRDNFNTEIRQRLQQILIKELGGHSIDFSVYLSENPFVQLQFTVHSHSTHELEIDTENLEKIMTEATLSWRDRLRQSIIERNGEATGSLLYRNYSQAFPAAYREDAHPSQAVADIDRFQSIQHQSQINTILYLPVDDFDHWHFRVIGKGEMLALSDVLPILEHMGVSVFSARPYRIKPKKSNNGWILDFSIVSQGNLCLEDSPTREQFQQVFTRTWEGEFESDGINALVVSTGLKWQHVVLLRALAKYLLQLQVPFSQSYMEQVLNNNSAITQQLISLFEARFNPSLSSNRDDSVNEITAKISKLLDEVVNLDEDRILRHFLSIMNAMLRTNAYQIGTDGKPKGYLSFKFKPEAIPAAPQPRPLFEIFVYSPWVEGIHMRGGKVARGGLRWSDRREDFRTEILGLLKAQMIKNSIIVPHGAKGGFVLKQLPSNASRNELIAEGIKCYKTFISGLLDITDNLHKGEVITPEKTVIYDDNDPYLVVAADKGTTTFSDIANEISQSYNFWLGDAFASGGSQGYDHKKMGITAKGAWESVKRLFKEIGHDTQKSNFTTIAIGDMAGDVFGNGMLLSQHIQLVAAFNHIHIFIDPTPNTTTSYQERRRLFNLTRSSWDDYNKKLISKGGGIYSRQAKKIKLSPEAREIINIKQTVLTPDELIHHILQAPADLLWNGGIGTYVKASTESHAEAGDRSNDYVRVDANKLQVKVVSEGGNLGFTQKARIEFSKNNGLINTDAVDNSGGVDCSDHEVNIKILLDRIVADGDITLKQRNDLLADMTDDISTLVLRHNFLQSQRLSFSNHQSNSLFNDHRHLIRTYEKQGRIKRKLECLPSDSELKTRNICEEGLLRPEISILLSHTKLKLFEDLVEARVDEDSYMSKKIYDYFPTQLRERFPEQINEHPLKVEILATHLANHVGNRMGATFIEYIQQETRCSVIDAIRAFITIVNIQSIQMIWDQIEALSFSVSDIVQRNEQVHIQRQIEKSCIWLLRTHGSNLDIQILIDTYKAGVRSVAKHLDKLLGDSDRACLKKVTKQLIDAGFNSKQAYECAAFRYRYYALSIISIANKNCQSIVDAARVYFSLEQRLSLHWLRSQVRELPVSDLWQRKAQASLRDQLDRTLTDNCAHALMSSDEGAETALSVWLKKNITNLDRWNATINTIQSTPEQSLAMLSVAVQELSLMALT